MNFLLNLLIAETPEQLKFLDKITEALKSLLVPILIVVATAGCIYAVYLGVVMAKAEDANKREEGRKRVTNVIIAMVVTIAMILLMNLFVNQIDNNAWFDKDNPLDSGSVSITVQWKEDDTIIPANNNLKVTLKKFVGNEWVSASSQGNENDKYQITVETLPTQYQLNTITSTNATLSGSGSTREFTLGTSNVVIVITLSTTS